MARSAGFELPGALGRLQQRIQRRGWRLAMQWLRWQVQTLLMERLLNVRTRGYFSWQELGGEPACVDYEPVGYCALGKSLAKVAPGADDVLLDYGCGMGRPLFLAAHRYPLKRLIGVEFSEQLVQIARHNIATARSQRKRQTIEIVQADAMHWPVPADVTIAFFFNPFRDHILQGAIDQLHASWRAAPRQLTIVYVHPRRNPSLFDNEQWLQQLSMEDCNDPMIEDEQAEDLLLRIYRSCA